MLKMFKAFAIALTLALITLVALPQTASAANYSLQIQFTNADAQKITSIGQKVTLVKEVSSDISGKPVTWVTFSPFQSNTVNWNTEYGVYASNTTVQNGATIIRVSGVNPAIPAIYYPFENGGFDTPSGDAGKNNYGVINEGGQQFSFGLAQSVSVNGQPFEGNPLNAVEVLQKEQATFTPIEKVKVFLQGNFNNGVVISNIVSPALTVNFTGPGQQSQVIHYDSSSGTFLPGPLS